MAVPNTRDAFKAYCLRRLGAPMIDINVTEEQVDDRVDDALNYYADYHFDGTTTQYYKYQVQQADQDNGYITLPQNIIGVVDVFSIADPSIRSDDLFNIRYQIALNDLYSLTSVSMVPYYMTMEHLALLDEILVGKQPIRFNRHDNKVYVDTDWNAIPVGSFLLFTCYQVVDPTQYPLMWGDRWLQRYCTALIKRQWGSNLTKFVGMSLPGGVQFNGEKIYNDAVEEIKELEDEMLNTYSLPNADMIN